ncbi:MAG TPA: metalloregulator ArsR/SmtB family transcription factor [Thermoanaerobaculia bacterium]|nr:metalloregulator ArsR/SmtB family transcription factor [Thermoanaerobaculia bacterium]
MDLFQALAEPRRREILGLVWEREREAGQIHRSLGGVTFGAVSQHLKVLRDAGAVRVRPDGRRRLYRADRAAVRRLLAQLERMWSDKLTNLKALAEAEAKETRR